MYTIFHWWIEFFIFFFLNSSKRWPKYILYDLKCVNNSTNSYHRFFRFSKLDYVKFFKKSILQNEKKKRCIYILTLLCYQEHTSYNKRLVNFPIYCCKSRILMNVAFHWIIQFDIGMPQFSSNEMYGLLWNIHNIIMLLLEIKTNKRNPIRNNEYSRKEKLTIS